MSEPREVIPGAIIIINRRCLERRYFLRPDKQTNNAVIYCLAVAAMKTSVQIIFSMMMSNHHHTMLFDPEGRYPEFMEHFHRLLAKCQNALRGRNENMWAMGKPSVVQLPERADVIKQIVYAASNPVKANLVEKAAQWPGMPGYAALLFDKPLTAYRPHHYFSKDGDMPSKVTLQFRLPECLGSREELIREVQEGVAAAEMKALKDRNGRPVLGRKGILRQAWNDSPSTPTVVVRGKINPKVASGCKWTRMERLQRNKQFQIAYREAWENLQWDKAAVFPAGTYWLRRFLKVEVRTEELHVSRKPRCI